MKSKRQDKIGIGTLKSHNSVPITDPLQKAEAFNECFQTVHK